MPRIIALYEKYGEALINQIDIQIDDLNFFRRIVGFPPNDPLLYGVYKIDEEKNELIFERFGFKFDIEKYDCFIEYGE